MEVLALTSNVLSGLGNQVKLMRLYAIGSKALLCHNNQGLLPTPSLVSVFIIRYTTIYWLSYRHILIYNLICYYSS